MQNFEISIAGLRDGGHLGFSWSEQLKLDDAISDFVGRGIDNDCINILLVTRKEAEEYVRYLKESGVQVDELNAAGEIVVEHIDELLQEKQVKVVTDLITRQLETFSELARSKGMRGLNIIGRVAANMAKLGRYESALLIELFWQNTVSKSVMPITVICPYESIPRELMKGLEELHNCPLLVNEVWEITRANFKCAKCGKKVGNEIRIHEPNLMAEQSKVASTAMKESEAGWIPFCFDCISNHPILRPSWLKATKSEVNELPNLPAQ